MNKFLVVFGSVLLIFIFGVSGASYVYQPAPKPQKTKQEIYDEAVEQENICYGSLDLNPERIGECISLKISRIDKQINLAYFKSENVSWKEQERLNTVVSNLQKERDIILDINTMGFTMP